MMTKRLALLLLGFLALAPSPIKGAQDPKDAKEEARTSIKDFEIQSHASRELRDIWQEAERRKQLIGPIGFRGYSIPAGQEPGPYPGPPLQIWGRGSASSLWRNPITGWPIQ